MQKQIGSLAVAAIFLLVPAIILAFTQAQNSVEIIAASVTGFVCVALCVLFGRLGMLAIAVVLATILGLSAWLNLHEKSAQPISNRFANETALDLKP